MKTFSLTLASLLICQLVIAQHQSHSTTSKTLEVKPVLNAALSDEALKGFNLESMILKIPAGYADSVAHRHDADLFGYVTKGKVKIELENKGLKMYQEGEMFYEPRNTLHTRLENVDTQSAAEVLLIYIIKNGRSRYVKE
jgi:quercetin dioxygenase-like cupin family protein